YFFFQAEDGIRDATVTGVQTCALPISNRDGVGQTISDTGEIDLHAAAREQATQFGRPERVGVIGTLGIAPLGEVFAISLERIVRSEERRVGKEGRCGSRR